jgi:hypothetical protein
MAVKYWEIIANGLSKAGWSWGWVSALDRKGRTIWIVDAQLSRGDRCSEPRLNVRSSPVSANIAK